MKSSAHKAVAVVGVGAILPDAPDAAAFWQNIKTGRYSISEVQSDRWDPALYFDPDPKAPDKSYSKIGGWVRQFEWDPLKWKLPIPPRVGAAMDLAQKWAIVATREALSDYGFPGRPLDTDRTAVIIGNALGGDNHLLTSTRILFPEFLAELDQAAGFAELPAAVRETILAEFRQRVGKRFPEITEDTMPGELSNIIAGRIAALYNFHGPNYSTDAACASAMAAINAAVEGLMARDFDAVITGGIDANMSASSYVKFCKIGALSATGTRPYAAGADGFVMGEGAALFVLKRLADAEQEGDKIYAVIRGLGASSDGKGKGITAPNPIGQRLAVERAWESAGLSPAIATMIEGHGTSTVVGDLAEVESLIEAFSPHGIPAGTIALGSVKSNLGHLKGAAGAAGILKTIFALHEKVLPPSLNFDKPNPNLDFVRSPFYVNTELRPWTATREGVRCAGVSAFGFGGTNFHTVLEEYIPGRIAHSTKTTVAAGELSSTPAVASLKTPLRGALLLGAEHEKALAQRLAAVQQQAAAGSAPPVAPPLQSDLQAPLRLALDYGSAAELAEKAGKALKALEEKQSGRWKALRAKGIFLGKGPKPKVAFLFTGQGSQYLNMLARLRATEPIVAETFAEADRVMQPLLGGKRLSDYIFLDESDEAAKAAAEEHLKQTTITQPAVLTTETALARLLGAYGAAPDMVMGHSLGEYGALVAAGALPFEEALQAVAARGSEMTKASFDDNGMMAAVFGPIPEIEKILSTIAGYVVIANLNSTKEAVIGGATAAVEKAMAAVREAGYVARPLQVSHAFHTKIVGAAGEALSRILQRMHLQSPRIPLVANVTGEFYPTGPQVTPQMIEMLAQQVYSPVQFVKGLRTLYNAGARVFVEVGPKRVLYGFVDDVLGEHEDVYALFTNHPRIGEAESVNLALCGLYAAGVGHGLAPAVENVSAMLPTVSLPSNLPARAPLQSAAPAPVSPAPMPVSAAAMPAPRPTATGSRDRYVELGHLFAEFLEKGFQIYSGGQPAKPAPVTVCISGAAMGLPGVERVFDDANVERMLRGDQFIGPVPMPFRRAMVDKNITRLVKTAEGSSRFEIIQDLSEVIKLAARAKPLDLVHDFGYPEDRLGALDIVSQLAIAAGIDALRDAGIPLVMRYKTTTKGTQLPDRWMLPEEMRDDTGVIFASAFPGMDSLTEIISGYYQDRIRRERLEELRSLQQRAQTDGSPALRAELERRIASLQAEREAHPYHFDRRFLFRVLNMGHSQFAEYIGARGPNVGTNGACASTTQAVAMAHDWIQTGRCRRVIILAADDVTSNNLMEWFGAGFLASGAAATDEKVEEAAIPFDRRRHGLIVGMGGAALVVEALDAAHERGLQPICEVLSTIAVNSAYHGSRLDVRHIVGVMEKLIAGAEAAWGISRYEIASQLVFVSHETYTPARGGSASAEVFALRDVFKSAADQIVVANTKGCTGHPMAVGIEDVVAVKILETGIVPPVANFKEVDPELGLLNLSRGGSYPVRYALRLGAGFGSQISMSLTRWLPPADGQRRSPRELGYQYRIVDPVKWQNWLRRVTGYPAPEVEVTYRTLRVKDQGPAQIERPAATSAAVPVPPPVPPAARPAPLVPPVAAAAPPIPAAAPMPQPAAPPPVVTAAPALAVDPVQERIMQIITEKTGYPRDMLDLDLDLEADLGIDTVKQAEMFAAIRAAYDIPRDDTLKLRDFPTLKHTIQFVYDRRPDLRKPAAAPMPAAPAIVAPPPAAAPAIAGDPVQQRILQIITEKTGYPSDMLDLDLDLEADLGIDTVKQAEMFAAIRAAYDIPRDDTLKLRDFPTLKHTIQFVYDRRPDLKPGIAAPMPVAPAAEPETIVAAAGEDPVKLKVLEIIAEKTGYPPDMLDLDLDLEADLGIDTVKQAEMFTAIRAAYDIPRDDTLKLRDFPTLKHTIQFVYDRRPDLKPGIAAPMPVAPAAEPETIVAAAGEDPVKLKVLEIIAEKTGYPPDMLDLDLDLEADLGIDTVKQAEMFTAIRAAYDIPRDDTLKLRDFPTLKHTIQFVYDRRPDLKPGITAPAVATPPPAATVTGVTVAAAPVAASLEAANQIPRRMPVPVLRPPLALCIPTGVTLAAGSRVLLMLDQGGVGKALAGRLQKLGVETLVIDDAPNAETLQARLTNWLTAGPIQGVYWLPALDPEGELTALDLAGFREAARVRVKLLFTTMRALYDHINKAGTFLVCATRLGGQHGYDEAGALAPLGGAVAGFAKSYKREHSAALVKVVDFEAGRKTAAFADLLMDETLADPGAVEIGYQRGLRWSISLAEKSAVDGQPGMMLNRDTVFLITGAAGSIVSAITADLAQAAGGTFHLLDLAPTPDPADPDLQRFAADKENLKRDLFERIKARGERATPALVEKELAGLERKHAALAAMQAVQQAGGTAYYYSVNMLDSAAVAAAMQSARQRSGRIDVLLHAAGLEISHLLPDKKPQEFDLVFDVKSEGWFNLLANLAELPLAAAVVFSSIAGRFGNAGQTDYSAANDFLCKSVANFRNSRPATRGIALDWTAWGGIGMAARGSIPAIMKQAGIDMLPPAAGIPVIRRELTAGATRGEVVIAQRLGMMLSEFDETGGLHAGPKSELSARLQSRGVMIGQVSGMGLYSGLTVNTTLDPTQQPFLHDHQISGTPVLPGVMGLEAMVEAALVLFPERHAIAVEEVNFLAPFKFYRNAPRTITVQVQYAAEQEEIVAQCRLLGSRTLHGQSEPEVTTHFTARVRLAAVPAAPAKREKIDPAAAGARVAAADIYRLYFHGPAYQVLATAWRAGNEVIGQYAENLPVNHVPETLATAAAPRLLELCFQTAGIWELASQARMGLPSQVTSIAFGRPAEGVKGRLFAAVQRGENETFEAQVVDDKGNVYLTLRGYRTMALPDPVAQALLQPLRVVVE
ncbi:SDR family NAD(P)-dependent oxidoreductase [bacterium]|nr:SDR family NAD(P)-dependent oxidoreductase [bacterium]